MKKLSTKWLAVLLLVVMAALMIGAALQDSATVDETTHLVTGYSYWNGYRFRMTPDHPPLGQMLSAMPLLFMDVKLSPVALAMLEGRLDYDFMMPWRGPLMSVKELVPDSCNGRYVGIPPLGDRMVEWKSSAGYPSDNWYYFCGTAQMLGKIIVYGGQNDGNKILLTGRLVSISMMLLTGFLIFFFTSKATQSALAPLVALVVWVFNPVVLAYGHLIYTDVGATLGLSAAIFLLAEFVEHPYLRTAVLCGVATGIALCMKFTAVLLLPIGIAVLSCQFRSVQSRCKQPLLCFVGFAIAVWLVLVVVFFPNLAPAPKPDPHLVNVLGIPTWFQALRPVLIPRDFFKGFSLVLGHSERGHGTFFLGKWSGTGWWYYFPVVLLLKSPVGFMVLLFWSLASFTKNFRATGIQERTCWLSAGTYLGFAMTSHVNIGIRHLLPIFPLMCIAIGCTFSRLQMKLPRMAFLVCLCWLIVVSIVAYPLYIQFFSEVVGGAKNGYKYSWDSNYDWGQDANRLKKYLDQNEIKHIYLDYFGTQYSIEYLGIVNTRISAEEARQLKSGYLVVSASRLVAPEWTWLRESRKPIMQVGHTLFVYQFP